MKIFLDKYVKVFGLIIRFFIRFLIIAFLLYIFGMVLFFVFLVNSNIDSLYEKYEIEIPLGSIDAKFGGGERYLYNEEVRVDAIYYTKKVDYLIKKYNLENLDFESEEFKDLKEKIINKLSTENKEKVEEYLSRDFHNAYYMFIENENGKLLLIYIESEQTIHIIENKIK